MNLQQQDNYAQQVSHVARKSEDVHGSSAVKVLRN